MISSPKPETNEEILKKIGELATIANVEPAAIFKLLGNKRNFERFSVSHPHFLKIISEVSLEVAKENVNELAPKYRTILKWYLEHNLKNHREDKFDKFFIFAYPLYELQLHLAGVEREYYWHNSGLSLPECEDDSQKVVASRDIVIKRAQGKIVAFAEIANIDSALIANLKNEKDIKEVADKFPREFQMILHADVEEVKDNVQELSPMYKAILKWTLETEIISSSGFVTDKFYHFLIFGYEADALKSKLSMLEKPFRRANPDAFPRPVAEPAPEPVAEPVPVPALTIAFDKEKEEKKGESEQKRKAISDAVRDKEEKTQQSRRAKYDSDEVKEEKSKEKTEMFARR